MVILPKKRFIDLNSVRPEWQVPPAHREDCAYEHRQDHFFSTHGLSFPVRISPQCVDRYDGNFKVKEFSCFDQYLCMAFAQLTYRESLRDIEACLRAQKSKLYHMGIRGTVSRNNSGQCQQGPRLAHLRRLRLAL